MPLSRWLLCSALLPLTASAAANGSFSWLPQLTIAILSLVTALLLLHILQLRKRSHTLLQQQQKVQRFLQQATDYVAVLDARLNPVYVNPSLSALVSDASGPLALYLEQHSQQLLLPQLEPADNWQGDAWLQTADGDRLALSISLTRLAETPRQYLLLGRTIDSLTQRQQQAAQNYIRDPQTGLLSRAVLTEYLQSFIQLSTASQPQFALLLVKFSQLLGADTTKPSATLQHSLAELSQAMQRLAGPEYILARYSNDTLAILVPHHLCQQQAGIDVNRLAHKLLSLTDVARSKLNLSLHTQIGISLYPLDAQHPAELIFAASTALQQAVRLGHSNLVFANSRLQQRGPEYLALETELNNALSNDEFELYYQPRFSIGSNRIIGYEALLRWHNPRRGIILPQHFLALADETGLIIQLDRLVFQKSCQQLLQWQHTGVSRGRISLNVATLSVRQHDFIAYLTTQLQHSGLTAEHFELELPEDILLDDNNQIADCLQQLHTLGFHLTLDNFGAGVSSLAALRKHPLHNLKIAPEYIKGMENNEQQRNITASLIRLASYLQLDVIASGIENEMQAYLLHVMGCDILQGHLFSKALPATEIPLLLAKENKLVRKQVS